MKLTPKEAMSMAIEEGRKGAGHVSPNPLVGCVILDHAGDFLAKGHHAKLGDLHAEIHALGVIADPARLEGAHLYVTLEPCAHEGRQPSCAMALARLPIAGVTYGIEDPDPRVSGKGAEILRQAGKQVNRFEELQDELEELAEIFLLNKRRNRPYVAVKVGASLDGQMALADGTSKWITGEASRAHVQSLRGFHDAVLTGVGTFLRDNPHLNSRDPRFLGKPQRLVLLDPEGASAGRLLGSNLLSVRAPQDLFVVTKPGAPVFSGVKHIEMETSADGDFPLGGLLDRLRDEGIHSVFVEAGPGTVSAFMRQCLCDRLYLFLAPSLLGKGLGWSSQLHVSALDQAVRLEFSRVERFGSDLLISARTRFTS